MGKEVVSLKGVDEGVWHVYTETSRYVIDLDKKLGMREPGKGAGAVKGHSVNPVAETLRADGEWFKVVGVYCEVGPGMTIICEGIAKADIYTMRQTTFVRRIEKVETNG